MGRTEVMTIENNGDDFSLHIPLLHYSTHAPTVETVINDGLERIQWARDTQERRIDIIARRQDVLGLTDTLTKGIKNIITLIADQSDFETFSTEGQEIRESLKVVLSLLERQSAYNEKQLKRQIDDSRNTQSSEQLFCALLKHEALLRTYGKSLENGQYRKIGFDIADGDVSISLYWYSDNNPTTKKE